MKPAIPFSLSVLVLACLLSPTHAQYYGNPGYPYAGYPAYNPGYGAPPAMPYGQPIMPVSAAMPMAPAPMPMMVMMVPVPVHTTKMLGPVETMPKEGPPVPHIPDPPKEESEGVLGKIWHKMTGKK